MSLIVQQLRYEHSDRELLFDNISFSVRRGQKVSLIGDNGTGKSTLLKLLGGELLPTSGSVSVFSPPYYVPQHFGQYKGISVARALRIDKKLEALHRILDGEASSLNFDVLGEDWEIEQRARAAFSSWGLEHIGLLQDMESLSGGEITKVFLSGISVHSPGIVLLDEPTNHLDARWRNRLYDMIRSSPSTMVVVSHDRTLLNLLPVTYELTRKGIKCYGGNYQFYKEQKTTETEALYADMEEKKKELCQVKRIAREVNERKQKRNIRAPEQAIKAGIGKMAMHTLRDKAEKSTSRLKDGQTEKLASLENKLNDLRSALPDIRLIKTDFNSPSLHPGKILVTARNVNFTYSSVPLWQNPLNFQIRSGDRIVLRGTNGSGKTTLLKLIAGILSPSEGTIEKAEFRYLYLDQEYSVIRNELSVFEQVRIHNAVLSDSAVKTILNRFLFPYGTWDKKCSSLSGGEKMKLALCCLMVTGNTPDLFIFDEPANNIDIRNMEILASIVKEYEGTVLLVSHDTCFIGQIGNITRFIDI